MTGPDNSASKRVESWLLTLSGFRWGVLCGIPLDTVALFRLESRSDLALIEDIQNLDRLLEIESSDWATLVLDGTHRQDGDALPALCKQWLVRFPGKQVIFLLAKSLHRFEMPDIYGNGKWIDCFLERDATDARYVIADDSRLLRFARKVQPKYGAEDLVLGPMTRAKFEEALQYMHTKEFCEYEWGFRERHSRGHGVSMLFHGESGTGKTMAAEVIASAIGQPLYQVDLSSVFSKYVGETEKNLRAVFEAAEGIRGVLLFDEGDALFGSRSSNTQTSQDRYANLEVNFLLQEMEAFSGIAVISTNHFKNVDSAFLRRFSFVITFQQPTSELREKIWRNNVPSKMPLAADVNFKHLSLFSMSGGSVRNCIREAAALAAAKKSESVNQEDFLKAIKRECQKFEKEFSRELVGELYWRKVAPEWEASEIKRSAHRAQLLKQTPNLAGSAEII